jgi:hypothetical protein
VISLFTLQIQTLESLFRLPSLQGLVLEWVIYDWFSCTDETKSQTLYTSKTRTLHFNQCLSSGMHESWVIKFCKVVSNICQCSVRNLLHVTLLACRIFTWLQNFWKICEPLHPEPVFYTSRLLLIWIMNVLCYKLERNETLFGKIRHYSKAN